MTPVRWLALEAINSLLKALLPASIPQLAKSAAMRGLIVQQVLLWRSRGVSLARLAGFLQMNPRQLTRWIERLETEGNGCEVPDRSRRPNTSPNQTPIEIQEALQNLRRACPSWSIAELTRVFNSRFAPLLEAYGIAGLSTKTVGRYVKGEQPKTKPAPRTSPRGGYAYPPPMTMAWIDTTHFTIAGVRLHIVVAMEAMSRIALAGEAVLQENSEVAAAVLEEALTRAPGLHAVVRDRGTPYLNAKLNALLADHACLPIDAHPHFPIDKAALERFFGTLKPWLRASLERIEEEWRGRPPSAQEALNVVRGALQIFLRAYNLIPQPYLDAKCPFERLADALKEAGARDPDVQRFHQLAREREDKDAVLLHALDALQLDIPLQRMRRDFAAIDKDAIRSALDACFKKLVLDRDPSIKAPYRYLLAVAKRKNETLLEDRARARRDARDRQARLEQEASCQEQIRREREDREQHPERHLIADVTEWLDMQTHPIFASGRLGEQRLRETLARTAQRLEAAFELVIQQTCAVIPRILARIRPQRASQAPRLAGRLLEMARSAMPGDGLVTIAAADRSSLHLNNLVREVLGDLDVPHDRGANVPP